MIRQTGPYFVRRTSEMNCHQSRMIQKIFDLRVQWTKHEFVANLQRRWQRSIFRTRVKVSFTKDDGAEPIDVRRIEGRAPGETHFNRFSGWLMCALQARGQRGCVVGDYEIVWAQEVDERAAGYMNEIALRVDY
jgi:hypothetical protein